MIFSATKTTHTHVFRCVLMQQTHSRLRARPESITQWCAAPSTLQTHVYYVCVYDFVSVLKYLDNTVRCIIGNTEP